MDSYDGKEEKVLTIHLKGKEVQEVRGHKMRYFIPCRRPSLYQALRGSKSPIQTDDP
jgi:hypothetical protein